MHQRLLAISCLTTIGLCCGCERPVQNESRVDELSQQVQSLKEEIDTLKIGAEIIEDRIGSAETQITLIAPSNVAEFDPSEASFQRLDGSLTTFAVSIEDVRQFADGVRVTLNLGNLSSATYAGATLHLEYGPRRPSPGQLNESGAWLKALQRRQEVITAKLLPGSWNPVKVTLPKIEQGKFGFLSVTIQTNQISLR